jgi:hypothetical protein
MAWSNRELGRTPARSTATRRVDPRPADWSANEQLLRHGFAGVPIDNVGVQYGLIALRESQITPDQFVDLRKSSAASMPT